MSISDEKPRYGYKAVPQLSANQMAEYVCSGTSPPRRRTIIRDARFPKTSIVAQYGYAAEGLVNFLADSNRKLDHLTTAKALLARRESRRDATTLDCRRAVGRLPHLVDWPTRISVSLDVTMHKPVRNGPDKIGGALFLFSRGETSSKNRIERSKTIAGLIYMFCEKHLSIFGEADPKLCYAVDVFGGIKHSPPGTFARKLAHNGGILWV